MEKKQFNIGSIPAILWGGGAEKVIIAVHGNQSNKADTPIVMLAENALPKGYQVLSFDLPEHGDRKADAGLCKVQECVRELTEVMGYAKAGWKNISLFGNSMGAYFSLMAYAQETLEHAWFLSPVVDMRCLIENMMTWFQVTEQRLQEEGEIPTPAGQVLYWDYYCYVKEHPVKRWDTPTSILFGGMDDLCGCETVQGFAEAFSCSIQTVPGAGHYFHTPEELHALNEWMGRSI